MKIYRARELVLTSRAGTLVNERNLAAPIEADRQGVEKWLRQNRFSPPLRARALLFHLYKGTKMPLVNIHTNP